MRKPFIVGETDETVNRKLQAALAHGLSPIICIGESLEQNRAGETVDFVGEQIRGAFLIRVICENPRPISGFVYSGTTLWNSYKENGARLNLTPSCVGEGRI